ncbi:MULTISPECIES: hypothetical protein [Bacillus cereus group]|uniref:DUF2712 domain-containing protein n=2 Tax=Bacillus cereus TaxID=1396 RepID=A0A9W7UWT6_BACCE|nr:hypothetical protein [Bacillus cereus]KAB2395360.1 hypothetical protein F8172_14905 [Bacillus cereus]KAB2408114.1 hypothetical protein F8170_09905 [Bacillus cereus]KAB2430927.1 hypothetical protein F8168_06395 [Bacillus cereus]OOZ83488.1 hypothetical protein BHL35_00385 [Bacillus cereus]
MKKFLSVLGLSGLALFGYAFNAEAANYKFSFDMNTGMWHGSATSSEAYKYTTNENPVLKVESVESKVRMKFWVINSDGDARSSTYTTSSAGSTTLENKGMAQNHAYRMSAQTDDGNWYNRYNVTGKWNPDTY